MVPILDLLVMYFEKGLDEFTFHVFQEWLINLPKGFQPKLPHSEFRDIFEGWPADPEL